MTRTIYIDPGTRWNAWLVTEGKTSPIVYVDSATIQIGTLVDLPRHKVTPRMHKDGTPILDADGNPTYKDKTRVVSDEQRSEIADRLTAIAQHHGATRAVIETSGAAWNMGRAEQVRQLGMIETMIFDRFRTAKIEIVKVLVATWRARMRPLLPAPIVGSPIQGRGTELIPILKIGFLGGWPGRAEHERDCGGMAVWDTFPALPGSKRSERARGPRKPKGERRARGPRGEIDREKRNIRERKRRKAARIVARTAAFEMRSAAGCSCHVSGSALYGRHVDACPVAIAKDRAATVACECREEGSSRLGTHRKSCSVARAVAKAHSAVCECRTLVAMPFRLTGRHKRSCPLAPAPKVPAARTCRCGVPYASHARPLCSVG